MARYNLVDINFNSLSNEEKRYAFLILDMKMKMLHDNNKMITSFDPRDVYYENGDFEFGKISDISPVVANDKESAILYNVIGLSNLAFCSYLPEYDIKDGLLHPLAVSRKFEKFISIFNEIDQGYYYSIFVELYRNHNKPETYYLYDYAYNKENSSNTGMSNTLIKATEAGKLLSETNKESAFSNIFLLVTVVACLVLEFIGVAIYYLNK